MRLVLSLFILLVTAHAESAEPPVILVFGDSLSAGYGMEVDQSWAALLQLRLQEQGYEHRVINASISGETTEGGATRIAGALDDFSPQIVILELGANDGLRGLSLSRMQANLQAIIARSRDTGARVVLLGIRIPSNYGARYSREFDAVFRDLANSLDLPWIEFFMEGIAFNDELLQDDRIHPNVEAQSILLENAWPVVRAALQE